MESLPIAEHLDVIEDGYPGGSAGGKLLAGAFRFQRSEETLVHGIVIAVAGATHADLDVMVCQELPIGAAYCPPRSVG